MESTMDAGSTPTSNLSLSTNSRRSIRVPHEHPPGLTSFNPFSEEEHDQSSLGVFTSFLSKMKSISAPLSSAVAAASATTATSPPHTALDPSLTGALEARRPSLVSNPTSASSSISTKVAPDRPHSKLAAPKVAPPLVSLVPAQSEVLTAFDETENERAPSRQGGFCAPYPYAEGQDAYGTSIPGFPIPDDARSTKTTATTLHRSHSVSAKVFRRIRGEGLSRDYWMDDENAEECYDCKSQFSAWRRKHHCRICGQIFCSQCASKVIDGSRFGQDGKIRVCNLCIETLATVDDDDDDDRKSVVSSHSFPAPQHGSYAQFPLSTSQIYGRESPFLYANGPGNRDFRNSYYESEEPGSRIFFHEDEDGRWTENPAPFRRAMSDDGDELEGLLGSLIQEEFPERPSPSDGAVPVPSKLNVDVSSVQFPIGSPDTESPRPDSRARMPLYGEYEVATPFIRSRVHSRLESITIGEPGWRTRRESTAYAQELNIISMIHLKRMLQQMLEREKIPNIVQWTEVLLRLALRIAKELTFTTLPQRQGQDMDVRRYVKIKKIPGGTPKDSEYVQGVVITKNVAHKKMSRSINSPRVMLVTFPLEFHRVEGQYMPFGQIVRQEKEYLNNLASRISALRPHVILVGGSVSRLALDALASNNIAVARAVKGSAIDTVARMTQGDVFSSIDKLALEPHLGHCQRFRILTFDHRLIPGRRKSYMRFEGCGHNIGCTILLRGGDIETLRRVKRVTSFLAYIVRNLKLETHLWKDCVISVPPLKDFATPTPLKLDASRGSSPAGSGKERFSSFLASPSGSDTASLVTPTVESVARMSFNGINSGSSDEGKDSSSSVMDDDEEQRQLTKEIHKSLAPYQSIFISVSATLSFPPPHPIQRMKELNDELLAAKREWEDEVIRKEEQLQVSHCHELTITPTSPPSNGEVSTPAVITNVRDLEQQQIPTEQDDLHAQIEALGPPVFDDIPGELTASPCPVDEPEGSYFAKRISTVSATSDTTSNSTFFWNEQLEKAPLKTEADIRLQSRYNLIKWKHEEQRRVWEWYLRKNKDDFFLEKYQCITLREFVVPLDQDSTRPCFPPTLNYVKFYGENDLTLGQFIEKVVTDTLAQFLDPKALCQGKACNEPLARHGRVYIHNETRILIAPKQCDEHQKTVCHPDYITTWSQCRVCGSQTPFIAVSDEMQRYSFSKFLELYFYPADVQLVQGAGCQHNIYQHHIRFFAVKGIAVRVQADPIILHEVVFPPFRMRIRPETQLEIKNTEFELLHERTNRWYQSAVTNLHDFLFEAAGTGDDESNDHLKVEINALIVKARAENVDVCQLINEVYKESLPTDTLTFNKVHAYKQDKIVAWQQDIDRLQKLRPSPSVDHLRLSKRSSAFGSMRGIWPSKYGTVGPFSDFYAPSSANVSEAEEPPAISRRPRKNSVDSQSFTSSASEISETSETESTNEKVGDGGSEKESEVEAEVLPTSPPIVEETSTAVPSEPEVERSVSPTPEESRAKEFESAGDEKSDSGPDSDSTIGAGQAGGSKKRSPPIPDLPATEIPVSRLSRLPRRAATQPNVADLVKKYSEYIPPQGLEELSRTAFPPRSAQMSESEAEYPTIHQRRTMRNRTRQIPVRKPSISDFEQGYAANVAPRYMSQTSKRIPPSSNHRALPGSIIRESRASSRRHSPDRRRSNSRPPSPSNSPMKPTFRSSRLRAPSGRSFPDPKSPRLPSLAAAPRTLARRPLGSNKPALTGKVSAMAKQFERLSNDRDRHYATGLLRGKRARPVVNTRARVEVLESIQDVIADIESESSDSSSEADDEGDGPNEVRGRPPGSPRPGVEHGKISRPSTPDLPKSPAEPVESTTPEHAPPEPEPQIVVNHVEPIATPPEPPSVPPSPFLAAAKDRREAPLTPPLSDVEVTMPSIFKALSSSFRSDARREVVLDDYNDDEYIFRDSEMVVRLNEPTSVIAAALNSSLYRELLANSRIEKRTAKAEARLVDVSEAFMPDDRSISSASTWGVVNVGPSGTDDSTDPAEDLKSASSKQPWHITFESDGLIISCTVLYPEQFDALRRTYDCEKSMIESLARCVDWNASGGKSGSAFLKTKDDRFIAKELSRSELQTMDNFAPDYFDYMSSAVSAHRPTLLAKIFGCYKLTFKKTGKERSSGRGKATQMNLLVMENLFHDRRFARIYDLKGSTRNRHVQSTGQENEVLLDENLVEDSHKNPFFLKEHSKRILRGALYNDSKFLADTNVMDYSLVCGVDSQNQELVIGIVDYIRMYTWDKRLESWVKDNFGAGKGEPTIVTPRQYRMRFLGAMERYFPLVPDRWMKIKDQPEEDASSVHPELWPDW